MSTWILIIYVAVHGGTVPVMQDVNSKQQCEFLVAHLSEKHINGLFGSNNLQLENAECVEVPK